CVPICNPHDAYQIASNTTWALMVGDGIQRTLGTILEYPAGCGIDAMYAVGSTTLSGASPSSIAWANNGWGGADKRRLPIPIVWPPNVQVDIELKTGNAQTLLNNLGSAVTQGPQSYSGGQIAIRCTFKGFRMTLPA
ncbi:MAG: hypothetical protein HN804_10970, partial [Oceanospirillaceae bacterium]|nr:hypothetical protein [Oceanospirillaceae bacterium]